VKTRELNIESESFKIIRSQRRRNSIAEVVVYTVRFYSDSSKQEIKDEIVVDVDVLYNSLYNSN